MPSKRTKVITGPHTRFSYVHITEATSINGGTPKFSLCAIIPKDDTETVSKIKDATQAAYEEGSYKLRGSGNTVPPLAAIKTPLHDGDVERPDDPAFAGSYFLNASTTIKPCIVDANATPINDPTQVYSGMYGRVSLTFYAYCVNGNRGIACGLNHVQKLADGEPLAGRASAQADFGPVSSNGLSAAAQDFLS